MRKVREEEPPRGSRNQGKGEEMRLSSEGAIDKALVDSAGWLFDRLVIAQDETDRAYWQGRIDSLADARRIVARQLEGKISA